MLAIYLVLLELTEQLAVTRPESWGELALLGLFALLAGSLIWALMPAFTRQRLTTLCRMGLFLGYAALTLTLSNVYSWHVRPKAGLYQEPLWVAQHPEFQRQLQARIERNRW